MASSGAADVKEMDPNEQAAIDKLMTQVLAKKCAEHCGHGPVKEATSNLILAVSLAVCKAGATIKNKPLYKTAKNLDLHNQLLPPYFCRFPPDFRNFYRRPGQRSLSCLISNATSPSNLIQQFSTMSLHANLPHHIIKASPCFVFSQSGTRPRFNFQDPTSTSRLKTWGIAACSMR
ncbi:Enolase, N-terminal [Trema orientale]|uniref:Enolase, N-terminal n=1 Tax=Trema orientale TaxID=63057 RepID=A0A2P5FKX7_TREOI|nr:Enolase, N-terminal [Trema orientale]